MSEIVTEIFSIPLPKGKVGLYWDPSFLMPTDSEFCVGIIDGWNAEYFPITIEKVKEVWLDFSEFMKGYGECPGKE